MIGEGWIVRTYLFVSFVLLPLDWFAPTGHLLREFGAKPAAPFLTLGAILILLYRPNTVGRLSKPVSRAAILLLLVFLLGSIAFWLNLIFSWSDFGRDKNPITQFAAQAALFAAFTFVVIVHARLFENAKWRDFALKVLPAAIAVQLAVFLLEGAGVISDAHGWLALFRNAGNVGTGRPSGLMSEPSYFGAFAALYGFPLLIIRPAPRVWLRWLLAGILFAAAILIRAKTFVAVLILECVVLAWHQGRAAFRLKYLVLVAAVILVSAFVIISNATLDMRENLSSVMRIGSTELALNVAKSGYGTTGVGFGQFHFFYRSEFAPNFIFASQEAQDQMTGSIDTRASTYNLFARLLVETGILGLVAFLFLIFQAMRNVRKDHHPSTMFGLLLTAGSLGFLCTQDTYFYPPLAIGLALLFGAAGDSSTRTNIHASTGSAERVMR